MRKAIYHFAKKRVESDHVGKRKTINLKHNLKVDHRREKYDTTRLMSVSVMYISLLHHYSEHVYMTTCTVGLLSIIGLRTCM